MPAQGRYLTAAIAVGTRVKSSPHCRVALTAACRWAALQEVSTMLRYTTNPIIILINTGG